MTEEKKERDNFEKVVNWIGIVCGMLIAAEIAFFMLLEHGFIEPSKW
jgi:hypothetical protein